MLQFPVTQPPRLPVLFKMFEQRPDGSYARWTDSFIDVRREGTPDREEPIIDDRREGDQGGKGDWEKTPFAQIATMREGGQGKKINWTKLELWEGHEYRDDTSIYRPTETIVFDHLYTTAHDLACLSLFGIVISPGIPQLNDEHKCVLHYEDQWDSLNLKLPKILKAKERNEWIGKRANIDTVFVSILLEEAECIIRIRERHGLPPNKLYRPKHYEVVNAQVLDREFEDFIRKAA
jgi:hypothetical protein